MLIACRSQKEDIRAPIPDTTRTSRENRRNTQPRPFLFRLAQEWVVCLNPVVRSLLKSKVLQGVSKRALAASLAFFCVTLVGFSAVPALHRLVHGATERVSAHNCAACLLSHGQVHFAERAVIPEISAAVPFPADRGPDSTPLGSVPYLFSSSRASPLS